MSANEKHVCTVHQYERSKVNKEIYRCIHPQCTHYMNRAYLEGKLAICYGCKNPFKLTWQQLRNKRPVCEFCSKSPKAKALRDIRDTVLSNIPKELDDLFKQGSDDDIKTLIDNTLE